MTFLDNQNLPEPRSRFEMHTSTHLGAMPRPLGKRRGIPSLAIFVVLGLFMTASVMLSSNAGAAEQTLAFGNLRGGVAVRDSATGPGYLMWSSDDVHDRFSADPPHINAADHLIAVRFDGGGWEYNPNGPWVAFTPVATDVLLAEFDFTADTATLLVGVSETVDGVRAGYISGDLAITPNRWEGNPNNGEFGIDGTSVVVDDGADPVDPGVNLLVNGGFEDGFVADGDWGVISVAGWISDEPGGGLEIWGTGHSGVDASEGRQLAELNINSAATITQDVQVNAGTTYAWSVDHRGRLEDDSFEVLIDGASVAANTTAPGEWVTYSGTYTAPDGAGSVLFGLRATEGAGTGNLIDNVYFGLQGNDPVDPVDPVDPPPAGDLNQDLAGEINVALNRPASQAPGIVEQAGPHLAVDGNRDGNYNNGSVMRTLQGNQPYLQIDLESEVQISEIRVFGRTGCCRNASDDYYVFIADDAGIPGTTVNEALGAPNVQNWFENDDAQNGQTTVVNTTGRYVRIQINENNQSIQLAEVEIILTSGATYVVDPGDQSLELGDNANLQLNYQTSGGALTLSGLPGGLTVSPAGLITGTPNNPGRWFVEATIVSADGSSHTAKFSWTVTNGAPVGENQEQFPADPRLVGNRPIEGVDGVIGSNPNDSSPTLDITVWDMQQLGQHMYVGGEFQSVHRYQDQSNNDGPGVDQRFLARFDIDTGVWDETFRPLLDGNVHALEVAPRGLLLVGGEFTNIDGVAGTSGLAAIDPATGQVDTSFQAFVERPFAPDDPAIVRELQVVGNQLYVVGNFSHINGAGGARVRVYKAARVTANYGTIDPIWAPEITGGSVWGLGVDQERGRVHLSGWFDSIAAAPGTSRSGTVDTVTGALVPGLVPFARNELSRPEAYDIEYSEGMVWLAGSQHVLSLHDAQTRELLDWNYAGNECEQQFCFNRTGTGGDFQFVEKIGNFVYSGCHCNETESDDGQYLNHYSGPIDLRTDHVTSMAYHASTGAIVAETRFDIGGNVDGGWSVGTDDRGCIWLGGDIRNGGFVEPGGSVWARGFARFCDETAPSTPVGLNAANNANDEIVLGWDPVNDPGVRGYLVYRDGALLGFTDVPAYLDDTAVVGVLYTYDVRSENLVGATSPASAPVQIMIELPVVPDTEAPTVPEGLAGGFANAAITVNWQASTDNVGVAGYAIYRDGVRLATTPDQTYTDDTVVDGITYSYAVLAEDASANQSALSVAVDVLAGDDAPPPPPPPPGGFGPPLDLAGVVIDPVAVSLSWTPADDTPLQSFLIYRNGNYYDWAAGNVTTFVDNDVIDGLFYEYQVRAITTAGERSERSDAITVAIGAQPGPDVLAPTTPVNLQVDVGPAEVVFSWDPALDDRGVGSYLIYRNGNYFDWVDGALSSYTDATVAPGTTYTYQVRAVDRAGNRSDRSDVIEATVA